MKRFIFLLALSGLGAPTFSQHLTTRPDEIIQKFSTENFQEKIYVHLDRTDHLTGEIIWFRLTVVDAILLHPVDLSKIAYVEILDENNLPVLQAKVALEKGVGNGSLFLPSTLNTGNYSIRAYTNWMKNLGPDFFFQKSISIINTLKSVEPTTRQTTSSVLLELFPEGGQFIENIKNRVAFKVSNSLGIGVKSRGALVNQRNDTIIKFETLKFGIGRFEFTPHAGDNYKAIIFDFSNRPVSEKLLPVLQAGTSIMVTDSTEWIRVRVSSTQPLIYTTLVVHTRQSVKIAEQQVSRTNSVEFLIDRNKLSDGISHFTIFDFENRPVCERLYFQKPKQNQLTATVNQNEYNIRRKVTLSLKSSTKKSAEYSISVFRADSLSDASSIVTNLLLISDLVGFVEHPEFYFSEDPMAALAADNLMLTHGWRRFRWERIQTTQDATYLPEVRGHLIQGKILDSNGNPSAGKEGFLASPGKKVQIYTARSDAKGIIRFQMKSFHSQGKLIAQTNYLKDSLMHVEIDNPFVSQHSPWIPQELKLTNLHEISLVTRSIGMQVQDIFRENETYFNFNAFSVDSIPFYGKADETYLLDDYTRFPVMEEVMREYIRSVWVRKTKNNFRFKVIDKQNNELFRENPLVLLDGVPVFDINQVMEIDPLKVKRLDVVARKYYIGPVEFYGIISYSTYNGDLGGFTLDPRSISINYEGLQQQREFYSPKYENQSFRNSRVPDQRHLLYWNPSVRVSPDHETSLDIFTSDVEGKFLIVVEGISSDGTPAHAIQSFTVSK